MSNHIPRWGCKGASVGAVENKDTQCMNIFYDQGLTVALKIDLAQKNLHSTCSLK